MKRNRLLICWPLVIALVLFLSVSVSAQIAVGISVRIGPPALPVYAQPICPGPGYIWTPGYWAWNDEGGYYWVPGTWVFAPVGMLWTPGWWGWGGGVYLWHPGYWGPHVGFYGGINYGYGYGGVGFAGGEWRERSFYYNRAVTNVSVTNVTNVYNRTVVVNNTTVNNVSYNGGSGGVQARPTAQEQFYANEPHTAPLAAQTQQEHLASQNHENFANVNQGKPAVAATARAGDFSSHSVIGARSSGGEYHAPAMTPKEASVALPNAGSRGGNSNQGFRPFTRPNSSNPRNHGPAGSPPSQERNASQPPMHQQKRANPRPQNQPKRNNAPQPHKSGPPRENPREQRFR